MTLDDFRAIAQDARRSLLAALNYRRDGGPPRCGEVYLRDVVAQAIYQYAVEHGQLLFDGMTIGVSPSGLNCAGLRSTNNYRFRQLLWQLVRLEMQGVQEEIERRWLRAHGQRKQSDFDFRKPGAGRFVTEEFTGFD